MKKISIIIAGCAVLAFAASCSDEQRLGDGQGKLVLTTTVNSDMEVVSRALADDLAASTRVWISNSRGLIRKYDSASELPTEAIDLVSGSYVAEGWAGDSVPASWDKRWFKAYVPFSVSRGNTTNVNMVLKIANTAASVVYDEGVAGVLKDISMTVGHTGGELVFAGEKAADRGYFMMPSDSHVLNYALKGTLESGAPFELTGAIADVKPATEYVLNVKYTNHEVTTGGGYFTIEIDDNPINIETQVEIVAPPAFSGYDFILGEGITAEPGKVGRRTVYITSASRIDAVELIADDLTDIISGNDVELFGMGEGVKAALEAAGINFSNNYNAEADNTIVQINFEEEFTDEYKGSQWSVVVKTSAANRRLFDRTEPRVIAYGEHVMETATSGEDMVQVTIPLDYARTDARPVNIIFVASASRYGDYFCGCEGSTMWLDDIELVY